MPVKRKSRGRGKGSKGRESLVQCDNCGQYVPRSKAKKFTRRVSLLRRDLAKELKHRGAYIAENIATKYLCVSCAVHYGRVKVRARDQRRKRGRY